MVPSHYFKNLNPISYILSLLLLIQLGFFIWAINRGFDFTDEAFGYLGFKNPEEIRKAVTYYAVIFDIFFRWIDLSIVTVRIIRLLLLLLCGSVFAFGLTRWFKCNVTLEAPHEVNLFLFILSGSLLIHAHGTQSFTYNLSSTFLFQLIVGGFFYTFQRGKKINRRDLFLFFVLGALLFCLFTVKFSNGILLSMAIILLVLYDKKSLKIAAIYSAAMVTGAFMMGLMMFGASLPDWLTDYSNTLISLGTQTSGAIWARYAEDYQYIKSSLVITNAILIITTIFLLLVNRTLSKKSLKIVVALLIAGLMIYLSYDRVFYLGGQQYFYTFTFFYILLILILFCTQSILFLVDLIRKTNQKGTFYIVIIFLILIPFFGAIGTNNLLSIQIIWYSSFLFGALYLLLYLNNAFILNVLVVIIGINAALQAVSGLIYYPYRTSPLHEESQYLSERFRNENIKLTSVLKKSLESAYDSIYLKTNFSKDDPIFSFSSDFGFIYFLDGSLPGWSWYNEVGTEANCLSLKRTQLKNLNKTIFILPSNYEMDSVYRKCFFEMSVNFPDNYVKVGDISYIIQNVERPLTIYAPKNIIKRNF